MCRFFLLPAAKEKVTESQGDEVISRALLCPRRKSAHFMPTTSVFHVCGTAANISFFTPCGSVA